MIPNPLDICCTSMQNLCMKFLANLLKFFCLCMCVCVCVVCVCVCVYYACVCIDVNWLSLVLLATVNPSLHYPTQVTPSMSASMNTMTGAAEATACTEQNNSYHPALPVQKWNLAWCSQETTTQPTTAITKTIYMQNCILFWHTFYW